MSKKLIILFTPLTNPLEKGSQTVPYAMLHLERMIRDLDVEILLIDEQFDREYDSILSRNKDRLILAAVTSTTGTQIEWGIRFSKVVKSYNTQTHIVWGGWHPSLLPEQTVKEEYIDSVIVGQGEAPFRELVVRLLNNESLKGINGLFYKENGEVIANPDNVFRNINEFPKVNYSLIDIKRYVFKYTNYERTLNYFASQGCPYYCGFCVLATIYNRKWFARDNKTIIEDLLYFKEKANIDSVFFWDDNFFVQREKLIELCQLIIENNINIRWDTCTHAAHFIKHYSKEDIQLFYKAGLRRLFIGAETGSNKILETIDKKLTVEDTLKFCAVLNEFDITPVFSVILCFPENPEKDIEDTFDLIRRAKLINKTVMVLYSYYTPYPKTKLYNYAIGQGFKPPQELSGWIVHNLSNFDSPWFKKEYQKRIDYFDKFYLIFANPNFYKLVPPKAQPLVFIVNRAIYPFVILRFKLNFFKFPIEAIFFLNALKFANRLLKTKFKTGDNRTELN